MNNAVISKIADAISSAEGYFAADSRPRHNNNSGELERRSGPRMSRHTLGLRSKPGSMKSAAGAACDRPCKNSCIFCMVSLLIMVVRLS
jgi:hypothetical protein